MPYSGPDERAYNNAVSLDAPVTSDSDGLTVGEKIGEECEEILDIEDQDFREHIAKAVREAVAALPDQQKAAVESYYFSGKTYAAIAEEMNVSVSSSGQLVKAGLRTIQRSKRGADLRELVFGTRSPCMGTGFQVWKSSGMSQPEKAVIYLDEMERRFKPNLRRDKIEYCVKILKMTHEQAERLFPV